MEIKGGNYVSQIKRLSDRILEQILAEKNIDAFNGAQGRILYVLWSRDGISLRELADKTGLAPTTLTSMVDRMEKAGLVCRMPDKKDRRTNLIHLTKDGKELEERARVIANQTLKEALRGITVEELSISQEVLRKIFFNTKD